MTCSDADENCPHIPKAEKRIPLRYEDPKSYDDTPIDQKNMMKDLYRLHQKCSIFFHKSRFKAFIL